MKGALELQQPARAIRAKQDEHILIAFSLAFVLLDRLFDAIDLWLHNTDRSRPGLLELNAGAVLALAAMWAVIRRGAPTLCLNRKDLLVLAICALFFIPPITNLPFVGATIGGCYLLTRAPRDSSLSSLGQLWLAISFYQVWGKSIFKIIFAPFVEIEAFSIAHLGRLLGMGLQQNGILLESPNGWSVFIAEPCSSFHNLSLTAVIWLSIIRLSANAPIANLRSLAVGVTAVIFLNASRILLMASSQEGYEYWHEGDGSILFSTAGLLIVSTATLALLPSKSECKTVAATSAS